MRCGAAGNRVSATAGVRPEQGKRFAFIVNPSAGNIGNIDLEGLASELRAAGHTVTALHTAQRGDAESWARQTDADVVVAVGGDGTVNEVVNGLLHGKAPAFSVLPAGTANVLATDIGLTVKGKRVNHQLTTAQGRPFWPGIANGQAFVAMASVMDA